MAYHGDVNSVEEIDSRVSKINAAGLINSILENLWKDSYAASARGDFITWNSKLDSIWTILAGDCQEGKEEDKKISYLNIKIYELGDLKPKNINGFVINNNPNKSLQYQLLLKKAIYLRRLQNKQGKGTAYQSEAEDDWD